MVTMYDVTCSSCGKAGEVPFKPKADKPVLCKACYRAALGGRLKTEAPSIPKIKTGVHGMDDTCLIDITGLTIEQRVFVAAAVEMFKKQAS